MIIASPNDLPENEPRPEQTFELVLGEQLEIVGNGPLVVEQGAMSIEIYWRALRKMDRNYTVFVQLLDGQGKVAAQVDTYPWNGGFPTSVWTVGQLVRDRYRLVLPPELPRGQYRVIAGAYLLDTMERLQVADKQGKSVGDHVLLTTLTLPPSN